MKTYFKLPCPNCREILPIRAEYFGKRVACKRCKHAFVADAKDVVAPEAPPTDASADETHRRVAQLENELSLAHEQLAARDAEHAAAVREAESAQREAEQLTAQVHALQGEAYAANGRHELEADAGQKELADTREEMEWLRVLVGELKGSESQAAETETGLRNELAAAKAAHQERDAVRSERDQLRAEAEQFRSQVGELERAHGASSGAHGELARTHEEARGRWETERQELHEQWEAKQRTQAVDLDALKQERDQFAERLATTSTGQDEAREALQAEVTRLNAEREESRRVREENAKAQVELMEQVRALDAERATLQADLEQARAHHPPLPPLRRGGEGGVPSLSSPTTPPLPPLRRGGLGGVPGRHGKKSRAWRSRCRRCTKSWPARTPTWADSAGSSGSCKIA